MIPSIGRIVHYKISEAQAHQVNSAYERGYANRTVGGAVFPMIITAIFDNEITENSVVDGQVFIDGNFTLWVTNSKQGSEINQWFDPRP